MNSSSLPNPSSSQSPSSPNSNSNTSIQEQQTQQQGGTSTTSGNETSNTIWKEGDISKIEKVRTSFSLQEQALLRKSLKISALLNNEKNETKNKNENESVNEFSSLKETNNGPSPLVSSKSFQSKPISYTTATSGKTTLNEPSESDNFFSKEFGNNFLENLESQEFSDVSIAVGDKTYRGHKLILSYSSEFFYSIFSSNPTVQSVTIEIEDPDELFPEVLTFLYGGNIKITEENVIPLLMFAEYCKINELKKLLSQFTSSKVTRGNALAVLQRALKVNLKSMVDKALYVIAKHFRHIYDADYTFLPPEIFLLLLKHDNLNVQDEYHLYSIICRYIDKKKEILTKEMCSEFLKFVRYRFFKYEQLLEVMNNKLIPKQTLLDASLIRLVEKESPNLLESFIGDDTRLKKRNPQSITIEFTGKDNKGVLYWIGTNAHKEEWRNPTTRGIKVLASSIERGHPMDFVRKLDTIELWTMNVPASWLCVDFGENRKVIPSYYTLVHGGNYDADILRTWQFQGSNDGENWTILVQHFKDASLSGKFAAFSWPIPNVTTPYRYFRVLQTGKNSSDRNFLALSGIEIYGELFES